LAEGGVFLANSACKKEVRISLLKRRLTHVLQDIWSEPALLFVMVRWPQTCQILSVTEDLRRCVCHEVLQRDLKSI